MARASGEHASLRVAHVVDTTQSEGPGPRMAIWTQGCRLRCDGCCNPELFDVEGGELVSVPALLERIDRLAPCVEGISLLGGEPFDQAAPAAALAAGARERGLGVVTFTGYLLDALRARRDPGIQALLAATDLLLDGPYLLARRSVRRPWVGSDNQQLHHLTDRYTGHPQIARRRTQSVHVRLSGGVATVSGWPGAVGRGRA